MNIVEKISKYDSHRSQIVRKQKYSFYCIFDLKNGFYYNKKIYFLCREYIFIHFCKRIQNKRRQRYESMV